MQTPGLPNDLCLLETKGTIDLNNQYVAAVPLAVDSETYAGNPDCWISGWGRDGKYSGIGLYINFQNAVISPHNGG